VGALALSLYVMTMAPGLIAIEDTPKFQFIGRILGTAHPPGYPFYVVVSHLFGWVPLGNLAWRINLLSAFCAALTIVCFQLGAVELRVSRPVAAVAALGLATGSGFWFAATIAEVYTLHGLIVMTMMLALLHWSRTKRQVWFFAAIAVFSIGLGHHTSIVVIGPAVAAFAIAAAPRFALRPRTIALILGLFTLGFSQYLFVLVRTRQGAWGESPASNLGELFDVIRGARWTGYLAPFSVGTIAERAPAVLKTVLSDVPWPALVVAAAGAGVLARRDRPVMALMVGSIAGVLAFAVYFSGQSAGFLQPAFILLWLLAAVGTDAAARRVGGHRWLARAGASLLLAMIVGWQAYAHLDARDLSHHRFEMRYFDALTAQLPPHSAVLNEDFLVDRMVLYEKFTSPAFVDRDIVAPVEVQEAKVKALDHAGNSVFAFAKSAAALRGAGFAFDFAMWPMEYGSLRRFLTDQPAGTVVALAIPEMRLGTALSEDAAPLDVIGGQVPRPSYSNLAAIGVVGRRGAIQSQAQRARTSVFAGLGLPIGTTRIRSPADIVAEAAYDSAVIRVGSRAIIRSREPVVAVWDSQGSFAGAFALNSATRVPMPDSPLSVHRLRGIHEWTPIGPSLTDLTVSSSGGHLLVRRGESASPVVIYAARQRAMAPRFLDLPPGSSLPSVESFDGGSAALLQSLTHDAWPDDPRLHPMRHVYRVALPSSAGVFHLDFGGIPDLVLSQWKGTAERPGVQTVDLVGQLEPIDAATDRLHVARDHHRLFLAAGWSSVSRPRPAAATAPPRSTGWATWAGCAWPPSPPA